VAKSLAVSGGAVVVVSLIVINCALKLLNIGEETRLKISNLKQGITNKEFYLAELFLLAVAILFTKMDIS